MRKWVNIIIVSLLLAGIAVLCVLRWQVWFGEPTPPVWEGDSLSYRFPTIEETWRDTVTPESLDLLVLGDIHNRLNQADYDTLAARVPQADAVLQLGDWLDRGQDYYRQSILHEWTQSALFGTPVIACPGNHEYSKGIVKSLSPVWSETFVHPQNGPKAVPGASYYIDLDAMRLIVIDTNPLDRLVYLTRTLTWLHTLMNETGDRYIVVVMHHPVLSAGKGRFHPLIYGTFRYALGQADLVLAGHDHSYMRRTPFVVLNTAGKTKPQHTHLKAEATDSVPAYGLLSLNTKLSTLTFTVYRLDDGAVIDSLYVHHD